MSHGNISKDSVDSSLPHDCGRWNDKVKTQESDLDVFIEKINKKIARILGKKPNYHRPPNKTTSNFAFIFILIIVALLLWQSTGFYYLNDKQSGIVLINGKISKIINGMKVGFVWPYPFSDIEIVDTGVTDFITISPNDTQDYYTTLSSDLLPININAKFTYQVTNPKLLYLNILQKNDNLDDVVKFMIWQKLHEYIANISQNDIKTKNLTVMSSDIKASINQNLASLGLNIVKLQIDAIDYSSDKPNAIATNSAVIADQTLEPASANVTAVPDTAKELIDEANHYSEDKASETQMNIDKFNQLLPQYQKTPEAIAMQMYYDMLEKVPVKNDEEYKLLNTKLSDLLLKAPDNSNSTDPERSDTRSVDRARDLNGRQ